ncbi:DUF2254 domain-containing protein [Haloglycomyces albus]|uniref:DUF2254 domain-containing protein n=1 Tax=Haloglycomyces albus TaxID=526067 RepID=UPI00046D8D23|nr:DUF2254 domain-containing protein [Haloglycomyces albus]
MKVISAKRHHALSLTREHVRNSFIAVPLVSIVAAAALAGAAWWIDDALSGSLHGRGVESFFIALAGPAETMVNSVSSAMLTFVGVVFSISLVALQMAANSFSQRVLLLYIRSRVTKAALSIFLGTFVYSMIATLQFTNYDKDSPNTTVPVVASGLTVVLVFTSLVLFIVYVNSTIRLLRLSVIIDVVAHESLTTMRFLRRDREEAVDRPRPEFDDSPIELIHTGKSGALQDMNVGRLVRYARRRDVVIELIPRVGDFLTSGTPVARVYGGTFSAHRLGKCLTTGTDRSDYQDLGFGLRQLVDIAAKALSPAVNDPTSAVQVIDRVQEIIGHLAVTPIDEVAFCDGDGAVRLLVNHHRWTALVELAFTEIRTYGASSPQVTRRLTAALNDLIRMCPTDRREALHHQLALLRADVNTAMPTTADSAYALTPDRQGIG